LRAPVSRSGLNLTGCSYMDPDETHAKPTWKQAEMLAKKPDTLPSFIIDYDYREIVMPVTSISLNRGMLWQSFIVRRQICRCKAMKQNRFNRFSIKAKNSARCSPLPW